MDKTWDQLTSDEQQALTEAIETKHIFAHHDTPLKQTCERLAFWGLLEKWTGGFIGVKFAPTDAGRALANSATVASRTDGAVNDARTIEGLSAQIVHAQMVLQQALGYEEIDYHIGLHDLAEDVKRLQAELTAANERAAKVEAALKPGVYGDLSNLANALNRIPVGGWESRHAAALGYAIGLLWRAHEALQANGAEGE